MKGANVALYDDNNLRSNLDNSKTTNIDLWSTLV